MKSTAIIENKAGYQPSTLKLGNRRRITTAARSESATFIVVRNRLAGGGVQHIKKCRNKAAKFNGVNNAIQKQSWILAKHTQLGNRRITSAAGSKPVNSSRFRTGLRARGDERKQKMQEQSCQFECRLPIHGPGDWC
jgi:hypothetical protein